MGQNRRRTGLLAGMAVASLALAAIAPSMVVAQSPSAAAPTATFPTLPPPEKTTINVGMSVAETSQFAVKLAEMLGIFQKYGITPTISVFEGDGKVIQALQAGQLDVGFNGTSGVLTTRLTDAPIKMLAVNAIILSDNLMSVPEVTNADELRGKCVAVSTYGGTSHGSAILSLQALGLTPEDVVITEVGGQAARVAALEGGACQAAVVDVALHDELTAKGFNALTDLKQLQLPWGRSGMTATEEWLAANPNTALNVLAATLEGQNAMWSDPEAAAEKYAEFTQQDLPTAQGLIADFQEIGNRPMLWPWAAFETPKEVLATVNPDIASVDVHTAADDSYLRQLVDLGLYDALGIEVPTYDQ
jgi:ABC-type nitrate/sulfonate/bicarbonate transport system substrate-binding protein